VPGRTQRPRSQGNAGRAALRDRVPVLAGAAGALLGALALFGWTIGSQALVALAPGLPGMQPWTAVLFMLVGSALALERRRSVAARIFVLGAAVATGAVAGAFLLEHTTGLESGLDLLLFREAVLTQPLLPPVPGRMAEVTALTWLMLVTALLSARARGRAGRSLFSAAATTALAIASFSILVHVFGSSRSMYGLLGFTNPAVHTVAGLAVLAIGALALRPDAGWLSLLTGDSVGSQAARRLGPLMVGAPIAVGVLAQQGQRVGLYTPEFRLSLMTFTTAALLLGVTLWAARRLNSLEALTRAERERLETEARLRMAIEAGRLGAWSLDVGSRTVTWDARTQEIFGASGQGAVSTETFLRLVHPADRRRVSELGERALDPSGDGRYDVEHRVQRPDGATVWVAHDGQVVFDAERRPVQALGVTTDITERKQAELHQQLMVHELNHRVKNTLATVQAIAAQSLRHDGDPEAAKRSFTARLIALSRAHDILTETSWEGADLVEVVRKSVEPFSADGRFDLEGPSLRLTPKSALSASLALHELGTNAAKYGALSQAGGRVAVRWSRDDAAGRWRLEWRESGGPAVLVPETRGFGSRLIERGLAAELRGEVKIAYEPGGVVCTIAAPLEPAAA
jgi:PAS domain S-box-containing protein